MTFRPDLGRVELVGEDASVRVSLHQVTAVIGPGDLEAAGPGTDESAPDLDAGPNGDEAGVGVPWGLFRSLGQDKRSLSEEITRAMMAASP